MWEVTTFEFRGGFPSTRVLAYRGSGTLNIKNLTASTLGQECEMTVVFEADSELYLVHEEFAKFVIALTREMNAYATTKPAFGILKFAFQDPGSTNQVHATYNLMQRYITLCRLCGVDYDAIPVPRVVTEKFCSSVPRAGTKEKSQTFSLGEHCFRELSGARRGRSLDFPGIQFR